MDDTRATVRMSCRHCGQETFFIHVGRYLQTQSQTHPHILFLRCEVCESPVLARATNLVAGVPRGLTVVFPVSDLAAEMELTADRWDDELLREALSQLRAGHPDDAQRHACLILTDRIRTKFNMLGDGVNLVNAAFGQHSPLDGRVAPDTLRGLRALGEGFYTSFRNLVGHHRPGLTEAEVSAVLALTNWFLQELKRLPDP